MSRLITTKQNNEIIMVIKNFITIVLDYNDFIIEITSEKGKSKHKLEDFNNKNFNLSTLNLAYTGGVLSFNVSNTYSEYGWHNSKSYTFPFSTWTSIIKEMVNFNYAYMQKAYSIVPVQELGYGSQGGVLKITKDKEEFLLNITLYPGTTSEINLNVVKFHFANDTSKNIKTVIFDGNEESIVLTPYAQSPFDIVVNDIKIRFISNYWNQTIPLDLASLELSNLCSTKTYPGVFTTVQN